MDFSLNEEQRAVQELATRILEEKVDSDRQRALEKAGQGYDAPLWEDLASAGLLGVALEEKYGGMGLGLEALGLLIECAGKVAAQLPLVPVLLGAALPLQRFGTTAQKKAFLPGVANGTQLLSAALVESGQEEDAALATTATTAQRRQGAWRVTGLKNCVAVAARAARVLVPASSSRGLLLLLVNPAAPGVTLSPQQSTTGEELYEMRLEDVEVPDKMLLAAGAQGEEALRWARERYLAGLCALALGVTEKAMRLAASYTSERQQFGRPLATFQAVAHRAANCYIDIAALRVLSERALSLLARERPAQEELLCAKIQAGDTAHRVSFSAQHLHGGAGVDKDYPLFRYCLWCKHVELYLGSSAQHLAQLGRSLAARYLAA